MSAIVVVQARTGSSRLPGKALMGIGGRYMLAHVLERAIVASVGPVVLATSDLVRDDACAEIARACGVRCYRGSEWDVLARMTEAISGEHDDRVVVRVTGDCPLIDPFLLADMVAQFDPGIMDYLSNDTSSSGYPDGTDIEVFTAGLLRKSAAVALNGDEREHATRWMRRNSKMAVCMCSEGDWSHMKLSVDRREDLDRVRAIYNYLGPRQYSLRDTISAAKKAGYDGGSVL